MHKLKAKLKKSAMTWKITSYAVFGGTIATLAETLEIWGCSSDTVEYIDDIGDLMLLRSRYLLDEYEQSKRHDEQD